MKFALVADSKCLRFLTLIETCPADSYALGHASQNTTLNSTTKMECWITIRARFNDFPLVNTPPNTRIANPQHPLLRSVSREIRGRLTPVQRRGEDRLQRLSRRTGKLRTRTSANKATEIRTRTIGRPLFPRGKRFPRKRGEGEVWREILWLKDGSSTTEMRKLVYCSSYDFFFLCLYLYPQTWRHSSDNNTY